jgi:hypothetical protein
MLQLATFPEAPLRSRTVGFPESGSGLGSTRHFQGGPSPTARNCGAGAPFAPTPWSLPRPFATTQAQQNPALCLVAYQPSRPPSAQSPFARNGRYPRRGDLEAAWEGRYPLVVARTGSRARPPPSPRLGSRLVRAVLAGCRQPLLGDGPSRHYLCDPCAGARTHTPAAFLGCTCPFFDRGHRPYPTRDGCPDLPPHGSFRGEPCFEAAVIRSPSGSCTRSTSRLLRPRRLRAGPPGLSHHASPGRLPGPGCGVASRPTWTTDVAGLAPAGSQPCRLLPPAHGSPTSFTGRHKQSCVSLFR